MGNQKAIRAINLAILFFFSLVLLNPAAIGDVQENSPAQNQDQVQVLGSEQSQDHLPEKATVLEKIHTFPNIENQITPTNNQVNTMSTNAGVYNAGTNPPLKYMGGAPNGVTKYTPKVYLVFWGSQWGTQSVTSDGYTKFSNDWAGVAPYIQKFFAGIGTSNENWSSVVTQYCVGVATGATSCNPTDPHILYPTEKVLAGVWHDGSSLAPSNATQAQIATEAESAASFFGNTAIGSNANNQYFVISPSGTHPDNFNSPLNWCAWHSYTSGSGGLAYTNMPYLPDAGSSCGAGFINLGNVLDGVSIVAGHEYLETLTDQVPYTGWMDSLYNENGDICAWIRDPRASGNLILSTGTFAVQGTYSNDTGSCEMSHQTVLTSDLKIVNTALPGTTIGTNYQLQLDATGGLAPYTWSANNLPSGLSINQAGLLSGISTQVGTFNISITVSDSASPTAILTKLFTLRVNSAPTITSTSLTSGIFNSNYSNALTFSGGTSPYIFSASGLPAGLTIDIAKGIISGIPTQVGTCQVSINLTDTSGVSTSANFNLTINTATGLNIIFTNPVSITNGFTTSISNYDASFKYDFSITAGNIFLGLATGTSLPITISNLSSGQSATLTGTTSKIGYSSVSKSVIGTATKTITGLISTFTTPVSAIGGFTVSITNYDSQYVYSFKTTAGTLKKGTISGSNLPLIISGLSAGASATITVTTSRTGYPSGTASVIGNAAPLQPALIPNFSSPISTVGGFTFTVTNFDTTYTFTTSTTSGKVSVLSTSGSIRNYSVSGLKAGSSATVTVKTSKLGYASGSASLTGKTL